MDFDAEEGIPLQEIYQRTVVQQYQTITAGPTASTSTKTERVPQISIISKKEHLDIQNPIISQSINEKFIAFEKKILNEFGGINELPVKKKLDSNDYLERAQKDIPDMFASRKTIEECASIEKTFFKKTIDAVKSVVLKHYTNVTSNTLATINDPNQNHPIPNFNRWPLTFRKYIMDCAYCAVSALPYKCIKFSSNDRFIDFHSTPQLAVTVHLTEFRVWDPKTGTYSILPKTAHHGGIKFSDDGKLLITVTMHQETPKKIIHVDIWDSITLEHMHNVPYPNAICSFILQNKSCGDKILWLFGTGNHLAVCTLKTDGSLAILQTITNIEKFYAPSHHITCDNYKLSERILYKKNCIPYAFCLQAINNTTDKDTLQTIRTTPLYAQLTQLEKKLIEQELIQKAQKLVHNTKKNNTVKSLFG